MFILGTVSLEHIFRSKIARSYRHYKISLQNDYTNFHSQFQYMKLSLTPTFEVVRHFSLLSIWWLWNGIALICISLHSSKAEHHFIYFWSFWFLPCLFMSFPILFQGSYYFLCFLIGHVYIFTSYIMHCRCLPVSSLSKNIFMVDLRFLNCKIWIIPCNSQINERIYMKVPAPVPGTI